MDPVIQSVRDVVSVLVGRIRRVLPVPGDVDRWPAEVLPDELAPLLAGSLRKWWIHVCLLEPVVDFPAAVVVPCDLSVTFKCPYDGKWRDFELLPPPAGITGKPYYLRSIRVFHWENRAQANELVQRGWRDLTILECIEVLLQTGETFPAPWGGCSTGSLLSRHAGIPVEEEPGPSARLMACLDNDWVSARDVGRSDPRSPWPHSDFHHHIAVCEETIDPLGSQTTPIGTLRRLRRHS